MYIVHEHAEDLGLLYMHIHIQSDFTGCPIISHIAAASTCISALHAHSHLGVRPQASEYHYKGHDPRKVLQYRPIVK